MNSKIIKLVLIVLIFTSCNVRELSIKTSGNKNENFKENFNNQAKFDLNWEDDSQKSPSSYYLKNGNLKITTRPQVRDRVKIKSKRNNFSIGIYKWRIYVPQYDLNDQCNIGAFIYHSGKINYEIDFEIGSGSKKYRTKLNAKLNEAIVYCSSQTHPHNSERFTIETEMWHDLKIELTNGKNSNYLIRWYINDKLVKTLQSNIKSNITFTVHNSLENLDFIGNQLPSKENYTLFDYFIFENK